MYDVIFSRFQINVSPENCSISRTMRAYLLPASTMCMCVCRCYRISYIKDRDFPWRLGSIDELHTFVGRRRPLIPVNGAGDVLFDGVSKREILTEQLSPVGIMWADGWREIRLPWNFRRTRYCSERGG